MFIRLLMLKNHLWLLIIIFLNLHQNKNIYHLQHVKTNYDKKVNEMIREIHNNYIK